MSEKSSDVIRVGSRKSELALIQTKHVISRLQKLHPEEKFEIHTMSTIGDRVLNVSLPKIGEKSLFTRDLEDALLKGGVDFVVHSLKDLPTALPPGMTIGAVLEREDSRDALVLNEKYKGMTIEKLPTGCVIGTSSLRRTAQLRRKYPHLEVCDIRGNLNTRLAKLDAPNSKFAGIILAQAGLLRMGWNNRISQILEPAELLYAVGQGALAVECRANDNKTLNMLRQLMCLQTMCRILAERSFLKTLGGGCSAPVAVCTNLLKADNNKNTEIQLEITGAVWSLDGATQIQDKIDCFLNLHSQSISETEEDEDVSPRKRAKPNEGSENDENLNKKQSSPKVINDDLDVNRAGGDGDQVADLNHLIELHGELFKRCPFYSLHQRDKDNGNPLSANECPLKIPVGQDFMGKCPYVGTQEKVDLCHAEVMCPVTGNVSNKNVSVSKKPSKADQSKTDGASTSKCPFTSKITDFMPKTADKLQNQDITPKDCPFLQKNIKLVDYEAANKANISEVICSLPDISDELFCGLFRHKCYSQNIYRKCENLGQKLADNLIRNGALDVMKCAQDEIREKI